MAKISINIATGSIKPKEYIVGIDLGTTNSLVAFVDADGQARVINDAGKGVLVPSVIHFNDHHEPEIGYSAKEFLVTDSSNTVSSVKRLLGRSFKDIAPDKENFSYSILDTQTDSLVKIHIGNHFYTPIELSALILKELKQRSEHSLKAPVNKAVITVPAYFNDSQRQATKDAGKLAGLEVLRIVNEPTAASLAYGIGIQTNETKTIAVFDLGGGTFDISILKIQDGIFEVCATHGDTYLGGDDFDSAIVNYWIKSLNISPDKSQFQSLKLKAEEAKKALNVQSLYITSANDWDLAIDRTIFKEITKHLLDKIWECCKNVLKDAHTTTNDIDEIILVGGSTRMKYLVEEIESFFGKKPNQSVDPDQAVALGAALQADILAGNRKDVLLLDVTPLSLGIETMGGLMDTIITRNSKIPTKAGRQYTTSKDGQVNLKISVYQGERDLVAENRKLGEFTLSCIPPMPAGLPKIDINFMLNADGILTVEAIELRSGVSQHIDIKPSYGLTDSQVEQMLLDSFTNAQSDVATRMLIEAQTEAKQMIYTTQRFIEKNSNLLKKEEIDKTLRLTQLLEDTLNHTDKNVLLKAIETLNVYTQPFAERVMDIAISTAMKGKKIE